MISDSSAVVKVQENEAARIIGKSGKRIEQIEKSLGIHIDIQTFDDHEEPLSPHIEDTGRHLSIWVGGKPGERVEIFVGKEPVFTATVGRRGDIRMVKSSDLAKQIMLRLKHGEKLEARKVRD
jgi:ATPase